MYQRLTASRNALLIGSLCSAAYLTVYIARNILSAVSPQLLEIGASTSENISALSSAFFCVYALGQLVNGILGDRIRGKYMVSGGLLLAGMAAFLIIYVMSDQTMALICYGVMGFAASMVYSPMVRFIAENNTLFYAEKCTLALTFAALFGAPIAGVISCFCTWKTSFEMVGFLLIFMGVVYYFLYGRIAKNERSRQSLQHERVISEGGAGILIQRKILLFTVIAALTGIIRTAVVFWIPTYLAQYLLLPSDKASLIFSIMTVCISLSSFLAVFLYKLFARNMIKTLFCAFSVSAIFLGSTFLTNQSLVNIVLLTLGVLWGNCAANMIWIVYCPSLRDTGMVATATGYLDFVSYSAASLATAFFGNVAPLIGWRNMTVVWSGMMGIGAVLIFIRGNKGSLIDLHIRRRS